MGWFPKLRGTVETLFQVGVGGPQWKNNSGAQPILELRDSADAAFANGRAKTLTYVDEFDNGNSGAAIAISWSNGQKQRLTLTANCVITFNNPVGAGNFILRLIQDGTGGRTVTWPGSPGLRWAGAAAPVLSTAANAIDIATFYFTGVGGHLYFGQASLNFG